MDTLVNSSVAKIGTNIKPENGETTWTDDSIRWTDQATTKHSTNTTLSNVTMDGHNNNKNDDDDDEEEEEEEEEDENNPFDIFKPDPRTNYHFQFDPNNHYNNNNTDNNTDNNNNNNNNVDSIVPSNHHHHQHHHRPMINIQLQGFQEESDQIYVSTGLTLWRAAEYLCHFMMERQIEFLPTTTTTTTMHTSSRRRVLELGAGLGLNGILAAQLLFSNNDNNNDNNNIGITTDARDQSLVILTDGDTNALQQLRHNVQLNNNNNNHTNDAFHHQKNILVEQLLWGEQTAKQFLEKHDHQPFDIILASDVVYVKDIIVPLFETVSVLLSKPDGVFYFAYCSRRRVPVTIEPVLEAANHVGLVYELLKTKEDVYIYALRWNGNQ